MVKRGLKLFGIGFGTLIILAGVIVGILFATGVIKPKEQPDTPKEATETKFCRKIPKPVAFSKKSPGVYTLYFIPEIRSECIDQYTWHYNVDVRSDDGRARGFSQGFIPFPGQSQIDIEIGSFPEHIKNIEGEVYLYTRTYGTGRGLDSEKLHYNFTVNP
jgi:hypothetical protein